MAGHGCRFRLRASRFGGLNSVRSSRSERRQVAPSELLAVSNPPNARFENKCDFGDVQTSVKRLPPQSRVRLSPRADDLASAMTRALVRDPAARDMSRGPGKSAHGSGSAPPLQQTFARKRLDFRKGQKRK